MYYWPGLICVLIGVALLCYSAKDEIKEKPKVDESKYVILFESEKEALFKEYKNGQLPVTVRVIKKVKCNNICTRNKHIVDYEISNETRPN